MMMRLWLVTWWLVDCSILAPSRNQYSSSTVVVIAAAMAKKNRTKIVCQYYTVLSNHGAINKLAANNSQDPHLGP